jgi:hypothetical protein
MGFISVSTVVDIEGDEGDVGGGGLSSWGSWAISFLPPISLIIGEEMEDGDEDEDDEGLPTRKKCGGPPPPPFICHYGFYCNRMSVHFCALERSGKQSSSSRSSRVQFLPFLQLSLQGIICDMVIRGDECNYVLGVSYVRVF